MKNKISMVDVRLIMSNQFNINHFKNNNKVRYGLKKIAIANFIIGILKSNYQRSLKNKRENKKNRVFFDKITNTNIILKDDQSILTYQTIAKRTNCCLELIRLVVKELIDLNILVHNKIDNSVFWVFEFINFDKVFNFFMSCKMVFDSWEKNKKVVEIKKQTDDKFWDEFW